MKALDVAKYFLFLARNREAGDTISNLKIQKMLYYAQGYSLALFNKPLFDDRIEAWKHGPVVKKYMNNLSSMVQILYPLMSLMTLIQIVLLVIKIYMNF